MCDREIDIVAAKQDVIAHRRSLDARGGALGWGAEFKEAEIRGSTADVDHQEMRSIAAIGEPVGKLSGKVMPLEPAVERGLRLFKQADAFRKTGLAGGHQHQPLGSRVEGGGNGNCDPLPVKLETGAGRLPVPGLLEMIENEC